MMNQLVLRLSLFSRAYSLVVFLLFVPSAEADSSQLDKLLNLVDQRLQLMQAVAAYKYVNGIEIENLEREVQVLARATESAGEQSLDPKSVEVFFRLQIQQAKTVQQAWIKHWLQDGQKKGRNEDKSPDAESILDLNTQTRPKLIELGELIVAQIPKTLPELHDNKLFAQNQNKVEQSINTRFVTREMKQQLLHALILIEASPSKISADGNNRLARILDHGMLRVGTTGDYQPFSFVDSATGIYTGVDIDLAEQLANSLGVELKLVRTSWPTLMADLAADQFDVGMSGISRTLLRQRTAFFSDTYSVGGKTPIARCDAVDKLNSLSKIDQPGIRVIVNPGGTNEKYVRSHIKQAQIISYPDNTTIFEQILDQQADVMITDAIEVKVQESIQPGLCGSMPGELLTRAEKGFLMPQDIMLMEYVNAWLGKLKQSGKLEEYFSRQLSPE